MYFYCVLVIKYLCYVCSLKSSRKYDLNLLQCGIVRANLKVWEDHLLEANCLLQWKTGIWRLSMICLVRPTKKKQIWRWVYCKIANFWVFNDAWTLILCFQLINVDIFRILICASYDIFFLIFVMQQRLPHMNFFFLIEATPCFHY